MKMIEVRITKLLAENRTPEVSRNYQICKSIKIPWTIYPYKWMLHFLKYVFYQKFFAFIWVSSSYQSIKVEIL